MAFGFLYCSWLFVGLFPFGNKFLIIQKKKEGVAGGVDMKFIFFWIIKNLLLKRAMPQQTKNNTPSQKATQKKNGQHLP